MTRTMIGTPDPDQPPQPELRDEHAERTVLAALLTHPSLTAHLTAVLHRTDFTTAVHRRIFLAAAATHDRGQPCTAATVAAELDRSRSPLVAESESESKQLVHDLAGRGPVEAVAVYYAAIIRDLAALRRRQASTHPEGLPPMPMRGFLIDEDDT